MERIYLIGFMGSGKTTYGKLMSQKLKMDFFDLDEYIEKQYNRNISQLFEEWGEDKFRTVEKVCLHEMPVSENCVIATGGGTPCFYDNIEYMNKNGDTIYLRTSVRELRDRLKLSVIKRPLIIGKSQDELEAYISEMLEKREKFYLKSRYILDTDDLNPNNLISAYNSLKDI
jgi:shikimate kinase